MSQFCPEKDEPTHCECPVGKCTLREFRELRQNGAAWALEQYRQECRDRAGRRERGMDPQDLPWRLQTIGIPHEDISALRGSIDDSAAILSAKKFSSAPAQAIRYLLLLGGVGVGKTLAAGFVVREAARRYDWNGQASGGAVVEPIQFVRAGELTNLDSRNTVDTQRLNSMARCGLLVVDDAGDEGGPVGRGALAEALLRRDAQGRKTVITGNLTIERFAELYGLALVDRIRARGIIPNLSKEQNRRRRAA